MNCADLGIHSNGLENSRFGHTWLVALTPVQAIEAMVTPVVFITVGGLFTNGLMVAVTTIGTRLHDLDRERLDILGGPNGELLTENQLTPVDRERLDIIRGEVPMLMRRVQGIRRAIMIVYTAMALLVLSVIFIAASIPDESVPLAYVALGFVVAGVVAVFIAITIAVRVAAKSANALRYETGRLDELGLACVAVA
ncbi:MAG TPA: DUF2721 domain-containing protein [Streptosporangiaceae bacterium]|nr:DUF2721 domain-containing protein [Streptosporangiaceae bacterium]